MRAEIEGHPKSDSVRLTALCSLKRNSVSSHGISGGSVDTHPIGHTIPIS